MSTTAVQGIIIGALVLLILAFGVAIYRAITEDPVEEVNKPISDPAMRALMQRVIRERTDNPDRQS
jgi:nitric oxide reductase large subunit